MNQAAMAHSLFTKPWAGDLEQDCAALTPKCLAQLQQNAKCTQIAQKFADFPLDTETPGQRGWSTIRFVA